MPSRSHYYKKKYGSRKLFSSKKYRRIEFAIVNFIAVVLLVLFVIVSINMIFTKNKKVSFPIENVSAFQIPNKTMFDLKALSDKYVINFSELLTIYCFENDFFPVKTVSPTMVDLEQNTIRNYDKIKNQYAKNAYLPYVQMFDNILNNMVCFPIPIIYDDDTSSYMYGDSWGSASKKTNAKALFDGTDIIDRENIQGRIPIVSVSAGTVTQMGWHDVSGFTITIDTDEDVVFSYAHLDSFADGIALDSKIKAGQLIGYMGSSGEPANAANHQAGLHFGISVKTDFSQKAFWINPYPFLRLKETNKVEYRP